MLHEFLTTHRAAILERARAKVLTRAAPRPTAQEVQNGVPIFLDQLGDLLRIAPKTSETTSTLEITDSATQHGGDLLGRGFTIAQVVHDYGDICQAVTELSEEMSAKITTEEFHTLNRCLDDAIAMAVTEYSRLRDDSRTELESERLGILAHEMRNKLSAATLAFEMLRSGRVGIGGSTGAVVERNLRGLRELINRSLAEVRIERGEKNVEVILLSQLIEEIELDASIEGKLHRVDLSVTPPEPGVEIKGDRAIIAAAITNLVQNAFKFTRADGHISLTISATPDRVLLEVEDECGGLPSGNSEELFRAFTQRGVNREGVGLGLSITRRGVEANGGQVHVRDLPGKGCVFTIDLPRHHSPGFLAVPPTH